MIPVPPALEVPPMRHVDPFTPGFCVACWGSGRGPATLLPSVLNDPFAAARWLILPCEPCQGQGKTEPDEDGYETGYITLEI